MEPLSTTQNGARTPEKLMTAQRRVVESKLADMLHEQAVQLLAWSHSIIKGKPFAADEVRVKLQEFFGQDTDLCGQLQAIDTLEHPGSASRFRP